MAGAQDLLSLPYIAAEALTKLRLVKPTSGENEQVDAVDTAGERALGVCATDVSADEATDGKTVAVQVHGVAWIEAGGTVTLGGQVAADADGKVVDATTGDVPVGIAVGVPGTVTDGDLVTVLLTPGSVVVPA